VVGAALALGLLGGCASESTQTSSKAIPAAVNTDDGSADPITGGAVAVGVAAETASWSPFTGQWSHSSYLVANAIFDPLAALTPEGTAVPYLAEAITSDPSFLTWTIVLRPGITFHNDEILDAAALKNHFDTGRASTLTALSLAAIRDVVVVDPLTVEVTMSEPWSTFPVALTGQPGYVAAPAMLASPDGGREPVGTGPFEFFEWKPDSYLKVTKNERYWREGLPHLDEITFDVLSDVLTRSAALESGSADVIEANTAGELATLTQAASDGDYRLTSSSAFESDETILALNTAREPFDDPIARQAIAYGLDQDALSSISFEGVFPPARGPFAPESPFYLSPEEAGYPSYDLDRARALVQEYEAKHGKPLSFTALVPPDPVYQTVAQGLQVQAREGGIDVRLQAVDLATLIASVLNGDYQASGFVLFSSPSLDRAYPFIATEPVDGLSLNFTRNDNPRISSAMRRARGSVDLQVQVAAYHEVQRELAADLDKIFLVRPVTAIVSGLNVRGQAATTAPGGGPPVHAGLSPASLFLTSVWVDPGSR
jgi:peptide/nickel transport system substrate-binding protein